MLGVIASIYSTQMRKWKEFKLTDLLTPDVASCMCVRCHQVQNYGSVRNVERGAWSAEQGVRSAEQGVRSAEQGVRSVEQGVRSKEWGARSKEWGMRSKEEQKLKSMQETNQGQGSREGGVCVYNHGLTGHTHISMVIVFCTWSEFLGCHRHQADVRTNTGYWI